MIVSATDKGLVRSSNQDSMASGIFPDRSVWACVCDGMGGANGGDYASSRAVEIIEQMLYRGCCPGGGMPLTSKGTPLSSKGTPSTSEGMPLSSEGTPSTSEGTPSPAAGGVRGMKGSGIRALLGDAIQAANAAVYREAQRDISLFGMGTTVVAAVVCDGAVYIAHAGDSRAYRISGSRAVQLTVDHSMVQELVDRGQLTPEQAKNHPRKNIITRALGIYGTIELDYTESQLDSGEMLLLCSDGLSNYIEPERIAQLAAQTPFERLADKYIEEACANGGGDNITAVIIN